MSTVDWADSVANSVALSARERRAEPVKVASNFASSSPTEVLAIEGAISSTFRSRLFASAAARTAARSRSMLSGSWAGSSRFTIASWVASSTETGAERDSSASRIVSMTRSSSSGGPTLRYAESMKGSAQPAPQSSEPATPTLRASSAHL